MDRVLDPRVLFLLSTAFMSSVLCQKQPNILLIVADDYGWNDIGYHGSEIKTPTLDKLASEGVKLENYYVQPICTPTRSQLLSGKYQIHTGLEHYIIEPQQANCLPLEDPTLADKLKEVGYSTHMVGKWHLGFYKKECLPTRRGFDSYFGYLTGSEDYYQHTICVSSSVCGTDLRDNETPDDGYKGQYSAHVFTQKAQQVARDHAKKGEGKPLFLYLPYQSVHAPMQVPEKYEKKYAHIKDKNRRIYAGMVAALDEGIKNVTDTFKEEGLWDNTVVVFTTDNGGEIHTGGNNWPLRGWKHSLWEGGVHGVGFVTGKGIKKPGSSSRGLVHVSDWFPTLIKLAGGNVTGIKLDGHDVWDAISSGSAESPRTELLHNIDPLYPPIGSRKAGAPFDSRVRSAIRSGDWKLMTGDPGDSHWIPPPPLDTDKDPVLRFSPHGDSNPNSINPLKHSESPPQDNPHKYIFKPFEQPPHNSNPTQQNVWLFNIAEDPEERHDVAAEFPDKVQELMERLAYYNSTIVPVRFPAEDPKSDPKLHGGFWGPWE